MAAMATTLALGMAVAVAMSPVASRLGHLQRGLGIHLDCFRHSAGLNLNVKGGIPCEGPSRGVLSGALVVEDRHLSTTSNSFAKRQGRSALFSRKSHVQDKKGK